MSDQAEKIYHIVSSSLHPKNVESIEGYNDQTRGYLAGTLDSFTTMYESLANIHSARLAAATDPTKNDNARLLAVADYAEGQQKVIARKVDKTLGDLNVSIAGLEDMLATPLKSSATSGTLPNEIRQHVKSLSLKDRSKFLNDAQANKDITTLSAVLGAPEYLSGLMPAEKVARTRQYHELKSPETVARLEVMKRGRDLLTERSSLVFSETEKAMGAQWNKIRQLREAKSISDKAFAVVVK